MPFVIGLLSSLSTLTGSGYTKLQNAFENGITSQLAGNVTVHWTVPSPIPTTPPNDVYINEQCANGNYNALPGLATTLVAQVSGVIVAAGGLITSRRLVDAVAVQQVSVPTYAPKILFASGRVGKDERVGDRPANPKMNAYASRGLYLETTRKEPDDIETRQRLAELLGDPEAIFHLVNDGSIVSDDESLWDVNTVVANSTQTLLTALTAARNGKAKGIVVSADPFFTENRASVIGAIDGSGYPNPPPPRPPAVMACYPFREYVDAGGMMSHGPSLKKVYRHLGEWVGMLLSDSSVAPGQLRTSKLGRPELVVNKKVAKSFVGNGITQSQLATLLANADDVV